MNSRTLSSKKMLALVWIGATFVAHPAVAADNAVQAGVLVNPAGSIALVGYERMVTPGVALGVRAGSISYDYWDGSYHEWGSGSGVDVTAFHYFGGRNFEGAFIGVAVGKWSVDWDWYDSTAARRSGWGTTSLTNFGAHFGYNIVLGNGPVYLQPSIAIGSYSGSSKDNTGTKEGGGGAYGGAGLAIGARF